MLYLLSMPGGPEWIVLILLLVMLLLIPIVAIYFFTKSQRLMKELEEVTKEKNKLLEKLLEQK